MTIIAAIKESNESLLVGADTMATEDDGMKDTLATKLYNHNTHKIAWGCSGNGEIARREFTPWMQSLSINGNWESLKNIVGDKIAELNGRQRERAEKARVEPKPEHLITCLFVGWLNNEPNIYEFTNDARVHSYMENGFFAMGSGAKIAFGAYVALKNTSGTAVDKFKLILKASCIKAISCGGTIHIKRVANNLIEDIT